MYRDPFGKCQNRGLIALPDESSGLKRRAGQSWGGGDVPKSKTSRGGLEIIFGDLREWFLRGSPEVANPFSPYSFQKRPKPQICPKFVPAIVFRDSNQGDPNLSKICREIEKRQFPDKFFQTFDKFLTISWPPNWSPEEQSSGQILDKFGVRGVFESCKGKRGSQT